MMELHVSNLQSSGFHSCFCEKYIICSSRAINWSSTSSFLHAIFCKREKIFLDTLKSPCQARASLSTAEERPLKTLRWPQTSRWPQNGARPLTTLSWEIWWTRPARIAAFGLGIRRRLLSAWHFWKSLWYFSEQAASTGDGLKQVDHRKQI